MREITYKNKKAYITEAEWKSLLKRFDVGRAEEYLSEFQINAYCILCDEILERNLRACKGCPLRTFGIGSCHGLIEKITRSKAGAICAGCISWKREEDKRARVRFTKIRNALLALPRVNRRPA